MATKAQVITDCYFDLMLLSGVGDVVQVTIRVRGLIVDGRGDDAFLDGLWSFIHSSSTRQNKNYFISSSFQSHLSYIYALLFSPPSPTQTPSPSLSSFSFYYYPPSFD